MFFMWIDGLPQRISPLSKSLGDLSTCFIHLSLYFSKISTSLIQHKKMPTPKCERETISLAMRGRSSFSPRECVRIRPLNLESLIHACDLRQLLK